MRFKRTALFCVQYLSNFCGLWDAFFARKKFPGSAKMKFDQHCIDLQIYQNLMVGYRLTVFDDLNSENLTNPVGIPNPRHI